MLTKPSVISEIWERGDGKQELEKGRGSIERGVYECDGAGGGGAGAAGRTDMFRD